LQPKFIDKKDGSLLRISSYKCNTIFSSKTEEATNAKFGKSSLYIRILKP
jgi:hypothetical protein